MRFILVVLSITLLWGGVSFSQIVQNPQIQRFQTTDPTLFSPRPLSIRIEQAAPFQMASGRRDWWEPYLQPFVSGLTALGGALIGGWLGRRNASAAINQKANETEMKELQAKLNEFYGRFRQISAENKLIAGEFKSRHGDNDFRTLVALLDPAWRERLSAADKTIVETIVQNGTELRNLIRDKAGLVDLQVLPYLAKVSAHFAMLELAHKGKLENDVERFKTYVYPETLDGVLDLEIKRLSDRIALLLTESECRHSPMAALKIPSGLRL
jgi:hypothetical protein